MVCSRFWVNVSARIANMGAPIVSTSCNINRASLSCYA
jgi:hypothetical protein